MRFPKPRKNETGSGRDSPQVGGWRPVSLFVSSDSSSCSVEVSLSSNMLLPSFCSVLELDDEDANFFPGFFLFLDVSAAEEASLEFFVCELLSRLTILPSTSHTCSPPTSMTRRPKAVLPSSFKLNGN